MRALSYTTATLVSLFLWTSAAFSQVPVVTQHYDNSRTGQNIQETILTHANVNPVQFGKLFSQPLDGFGTGQPLYVPNVFIPALNSTHNVVYVATMHDSVYAFDADNNQGSNAAPLWQVSFINPANGITTVPLADEKCNVTGYTEYGIQGTPVIDLTRNAIYVLDMTKENGNYVHKLHALDLGSGQELFGGPVAISASVVIDGQTYTFVDKYQQDRAALLLQDGNVYIGFGGPGCNIKTEMGWVIAYDGGSLQQVGAFNVSPGVDASAIWLSGAGMAGDGAGNIYFSTGDGLFDGPNGTHFGDSVLKLTQGQGVLTLADSFTPFNQLFFQQNDLDVSSGMVVLLPQQPDGSQFVLANDKDGSTYLLDQNDLGGYNPAGNFQIPQELDIPVNGQMHGGLTYWNNTIYTAAEKTPIMAYSFANDQLSTAPVSQSSKATANPTGGIISANGTQNGIFWYVTFPTNKLFAFDATNLATELYDTGLAGPRDTLGKTVHFGMPLVVDGHAYVEGQTRLDVLGLLPLFAAVGGNNQTGPVGTTLPIALQAGLQDPYSGAGIGTAGIPVTFEDGGKTGGSFSNPNATTNSSGVASTNYTLPTKPGTYTITAESTGYASAIFTVTATGGTPATLSISSGNQQSASVNSALSSPLKARVKDVKGNGVAGISVSFTDNGAGGTLSPATAVTDSGGYATITYTTGTKAGVVSITASASGLTSVIFKETVLAGPAASLAISSGNNQTIKAGKAAPKLMQVIAADQYNNPVRSVSVTFSDNGAGGSFVPNPAVTNPKGIAGSRYTAPAQKGPVSITASSPGLNSVTFSATVD